MSIDFNIVTYPFFKLEERLLTLPIVYLKQLRDYYNQLYAIGQSDLSDDRYDILQSVILKLDPTFKIEVGAKLREGENRMNLPYWMGSANKITPNDEKEFEKWKETFKCNEYVISDKLDGISCLIFYKDGKINLFTRGDGEIGADISYLAPYFNLPSYQSVGNIAVRGEIVISKNTFDTKYKDKAVDGRKYQNPRNMAAGLINAKTAREGLNDLKLVCYEIIDSVNTPIYEQFKKLKKLKFNVVKYIITNGITIPFLSEYLIKRKQEGEYLIDGLIVQNNNIYYRNDTGNPVYMFAFKISNEMTITEVLGVEWSVSKWGLIIPVVLIKPVVLDGVTINRSTVHHAKRIYESGIGKGAIIGIVRRGEVIPHVESVIKPVKPDMPDDPPYNYPWVWDKTKVNAVINGDGHNDASCIKIIASFFEKMGIKQIGEKTVEAMYTNGLNNLMKIISASEERLKQVPSFNKKATNISTAIKAGLQGVRKPTVIGASGVLSMSIGRERVELLFDHIPNILILYKTISSLELKQKILNISGFGDVLADKIIANLENADKFIEKIRPYATFKEDAVQPTTAVGVARVISQNLTNQKIVMSGFRDADLKVKIENRGGKVLTAISGMTTMLIVKDKTNLTGKPLVAMQKGIPIYSREEFVAKYFI